MEGDTQEGVSFKDLSGVERDSSWDCCERLGNLRMVAS